ncbi:MAG TPA: EthD family reductase [Acetobacteraceae bacterium]|nr:EthD family reductase [Acetobacteraceae bacterium]
MILVSVFYPYQQGARFDVDYYLNKHMKHVHQCWDGMGLKMARVLRGQPSPDGKPPVYEVMAHLGFESLDAFKAAVEAHGGEIFGDIPNFTDIKPETQISEILA